MRIKWLLLFCVYVSCSPLPGVATVSDREVKMEVWCIFVSVESISHFNVEHRHRLISRCSTEKRTGIPVVDTKKFCFV